MPSSRPGRRARADHRIVRAVLLLPGRSLEPNGFDAGLSPIALYPLFAGVASAGVIALRRFANAQLAVRLGSFTWEQVHVLLGLFALLIVLGYSSATTVASASASATGCCSAGRSRCSPAR